MWDMKDGEMIEEERGQAAKQLPSVTVTRGFSYVVESRENLGSSLCWQGSAVQETLFLILGQEDPLEEGMAAHPSILAWRESPWTEELAGHSPRSCKQSDMTERLSSSIYIKQTNKKQGNY